MALKSYEESDIKATADAIRKVTNTTNPMLTSEMANRVLMATTNSNPNGLEQRVLDAEAKITALQSKDTSLDAAKVEAKIYRNISVAASAFTSVSGVYRASITNSNITANDFVELYQDASSGAIGTLLDYNDSYAGGVYVYASAVPEKAVVFNLMIVNKNYKEEVI